MTDDNRDLILQAVFTKASQDLAGDTFVAQVMSQTEKLKRRAFIGRIFGGVAVAMLAVPLQNAVPLLTEVLVTSLIDLRDGLLSQMLAPVNSVGSVLSLGLLALRFAYKKFFARRSI